MKIILPVSFFLFLFIQVFGEERSSFTSQSVQQKEKMITLHLINYSWHTGLIIPVNDFTIKHIPVINYFKDYDYVDIGWGDEEFYQHPDFDLYLGAKAIIYPTPSVIRIEGYHLEIDFIIDLSEFAIRFDLTEGNFIKLSEFINQSFSSQEPAGYKITSKQKNGKIVFYASSLKYHLFNTCNTWAAKALKSAGFNVEPTGIITDDQLFEKIKKHGIVVKSDKKKRK